MTLIAMCDMARVIPLSFRNDNATVWMTAYWRSTCDKRIAIYTFKIDAANSVARCCSSTELQTRRRHPHYLTHTLIHTSIRPGIIIYWSRSMVDEEDAICMCILCAISASSTRHAAAAFALSEPARSHRWAPMSRVVSLSAFQRKLLRPVDYFIFCVLCPVCFARILCHGWWMVKKRGWVGEEDGNVSDRRLVLIFINYGIWGAIEMWLCELRECTWRISFSVIYGWHSPGILYNLKENCNRIWTPNEL